MFYNESIPIYVKSQEVGRVTGRTFRKRLRGSKHFLRKPQAIAFDTDTLHDAADAGAALVEVTDTETGKVYRARIDDILRDGKRFNRGFGDQIFYPLKRWTQPGEPGQLTLFENVDVSAATPTPTAPENRGKVIGGAW